MNNDAEIEVRVLEERDRQGHSKQVSGEWRLLEAKAAWPAHNHWRRIPIMSASAKLGHTAPLRRGRQGLRAWEGLGIETIQYAIDNEIHHRGQGYVYPPRSFLLRSKPR